MKNYKVTFSTLKIAAIAGLMTVLMVAIKFDLTSTTAAFLNSTIVAMSNKVEAGAWTPDTPTNLGWNNPTDSSTPNEGNPDNLDHTCGDITNGGNSNAPRIAHNWTPVTGTNIVYQREITYPDGRMGYFYETNNHTGFVTFSTPAGIEGLWNSRVRAFEDINNNGVYDDGTDVAGEWSNYCEITLDTTGPELSYANIPLDVPLLSVDGNFEIRGYVIDDNLNSYQVVIVESDVTGTVEGTEVANHTQDPAIASPLQRILYTWDVSLADGYYKVKLSATDSLGNTENIEEVVRIENPSPPTSTITISNSPEKDMDNRVANSSFEDDLNGWNIEGAVTTVEAEADISPYDGSYMLRMGHPEGMSKTASVAQSIDNSGKGLRSVGFWYKVVAADGSDRSEPSFAVYVGDEMVHQVWPSDVTVQKADWQYASIYLVEKDVSAHDLRLELSDPTAQVYVDNITTDSTVVNETAVFTITADEQAEDSTVHYRYTVNGREYTGQGESGLTFSLFAQPDNMVVEHWTVDGLGQVGTKEKIYVIYDNQAPTAVADLKVQDEGTGDYLVTFTAPSDNITNSANTYEIRYAQEEITEETWGTAAIAEAKDATGAHGKLTAPRAAGSSESILVSGLEPSMGYYFAVKSADATNRWSEISNVALPEGYTDVEGGADGMGVVINEAKVEGDTAWIELYNMTKEDIDANDWIIKTSGSHEVISSSNGDNNLNENDAGETVVPANGYLVVKVSNLESAISLLTEEVTVDEVLFDDTSVEDQSEGREKDGSESWTAELLRSPGRKNTTSTSDLDPLAVLTQQEDFNARVRFYDAVNYTTAEYSIVYEHDHDGQTISEQIEGSVGIDSLTVEKGSIYFATCSSGGDCAPHYGVMPESIKMEAVLKGDGVPDRTIKTGLTGKWKEPEATDEAELESVETKE